MTLPLLESLSGRNAHAAGRERRYQINEAQFARAVAQLNAVGSAWDSRLARVKRIAETIQRSQQQ